MKKVIIQLYYIKYIELCCAYCHYMNLHKSHKIIPINDEETLKKENISINDYIKDFDISAICSKCKKYKRENRE